MKILVTGGAGFIGSNVVDAYIENGYEVIVVDDGSTDGTGNIARQAGALYDKFASLAKDLEEVNTHIGKAQVLAVFPISKVGKIAGCRVLDGELRRSGRVRLTRGTDIVFEGEIASLKHEKEDVREIRNGQECGIGFKNFNEVLVGDILECFTLEKNN